MVGNKKDTSRLKSLFFNKYYFFPRFELFAF